MELVHWWRPSKSLMLRCDLLVFFFERTGLSPAQMTNSQEGNSKYPYSKIKRWGHCACRCSSCRDRNSAGRPIDGTEVIETRDGTSYPTEHSTQIVYTNMRVRFTTLCTISNNFSRYLLAGLDHIIWCCSVFLPVCQRFYSIMVTYIRCSWS